jgi:hypothetical protein
VDLVVGVAVEEGQELNEEDLVLAVVTMNRQWLLVYVVGGLKHAGNIVLNHSRYTDKANQI